MIETLWSLNMEYNLSISLGSKPRWLRDQYPEEDSTKNWREGEERDCRKSQEANRFCNIRIEDIAQEVMIDTIISVLRIFNFPLFFLIDIFFSSSDNTLINNNKEKSLLLASR